MKSVTFDHPNKMHFESAHGTFNTQTVLLTPGNALLPTQYSSYIRPAQETECAGQSHEEGSLQEWDLRPFSALVGLHSPLKEVRKIINERGTSAILYLFHHMNGEHVIHDGLLLTTGASEGYYELCRWYLNEHWRAKNAFDEAICYVTNPKPE